jgi:CheY-like chemotaxis protein
MDEAEEQVGMLVYVVDDQEVFAEVVAAILRSEDYDTETFDCAEAAVAALEKGGHPAILLTDYVMPGMNGMELIIKSRMMVNGIRTVLFSGQVDDDVVQKYAVKPDLFVRKPFEPGQLLEALAALRA